MGGVREECVEGSTYQPNPSQTSCLTCSTCSAGTYETSACTTTSDTVCEPCLAGFACLEGLKAPCTATSTYQPDPSKSSCLTCSTCPAGAYETSACTTTSDTVCEPCPAGFACLEGVKASCTATSTYQPDPSKSSCLTCSTCATGRYMINACTSTSEIECGDCLAGTVSMGGTVAECTQCNVDGKYSDTDNASFCLTAKAGYKPTSDRKVRMNLNKTGTGT